MKLLLRILYRLSILSKLNFQIPYPLESSIKLPILQAIGYEHLFEKERWLFQLLKFLIPLSSGNSVFIDVGVNTGQTLLKVMAINPSTPYIGFEPNPNCLHYVYELIRRNKFSSITIFPFAVSDKSGVIDLELYSSSTTDSLASIVPDFRKKKYSIIKVPVIRGEDIGFLNEIKAGIIKIDVEGGELEVIKGLFSVIKRNRPILVCEVLPVYSIENQSRWRRQNELESMLRSMSYLILRIEGPDSFVEIQSIGIHHDIDRVNYLFYPSERRNELIGRITTG